MATTPVHTGKAEHRTLSFRTLDDLLAEVERVAAAERAGKLRRTGNWTTGQVLGHLSTWLDFPHEGYPADLRPPWFIKPILRLQRNRFFKGPMPLGVRIPGTKDGTIGTQVIGLDEGLERLKRSCDRMRATAPTIENPIFGKLTHDQWISINLRHAELHLGFLHPG